MIETLTDVDASRGLLFVGIAIATALAGYHDNVRKDPDMDWQSERAIPTVLIGAVAGVIVVTFGGEIETAAFDAVIAALIPIADELRGAKGEALLAARKAREEGASPTEQAVAGATAGARTVDVDRINESVDEIDDAVEQSEGPTPEPADEPDPRGEETIENGG